MINRVVYVLVVLVIAYNIWFDSYEEKKHLLIRYDVIYH